MNKRSFFPGLAICAAAVMLLAGCATGGSGSKDSIITLQMSEEAKQYEAETLSQDGVKTMLSEDYFDLVIQALTGREEQSFPACEVENTLEYTEFESSKVYSLAAKEYENLVLYIHGGAWAFEISEEHIQFCDKLATRLNAKVYMPLYPLAPEADSEETYAMIESLYKELAGQGKKVIIMGDSAGGNIALGLMYAIKEQNLPKPEKMILIAPCSDMTLSNDAIQELNQTDPELEQYGCSRCAVLWAGEENLKSPKYSALFADVTGYPDTLLFQGTNDILCPDNLILYQNLKNAGVTVTLVKGEGLWHVFPIYPIPERETALELIEQFCGQTD